MIDKLFFQTVVMRHHETLFTKPSNLSLQQTPGSRNHALIIPPNLVITPVILYNKRSEMPRPFNHSHDDFSSLVNRSSGARSCDL